MFRINQACEATWLAGFGPDFILSGVRRLWTNDRLLMPRVFMVGPRWRSAFGVRNVPIAEFDPASASLHRPKKKILVFTLEDDVRELVLEQLRPGVVAAWSDPREHLGIHGGLVQRRERRSHKPEVEGSIPSPATNTGRRRG